MRIFLDANVLFAASKRGSSVEKLLNLLLKKGTALTSDYALREAKRNIDAKRPGWAEDFSVLTSAIEIASSTKWELSVQLVEKDVPILCTAIREKCNYLLTGDKRDFGHLYGTVIQGVEIISLPAMADLLLAQWDC